MFASLSTLMLLLAGFDLGHLPVLAIPIWDQYVDFIEWALERLARSFNSGGLSIIVFTIGIKTLLMPLTVQSIRSSKAMQELQPKIKELQKKYGKDRQRLTQETMQLYSQHHVNPMSGCLPMLLQIPIFLGLYNAIRHLSRSDDAYWSGTFLWLRDGLNEHDPFFILPIAAGLFQFVQTRMMRPANQGKITDPQQAMMNTMMNFMPLTVIVFGWQFASGAVLYWATQSVYSVIQQWFITGWGSLGNWFPWLPEMPEHRRLGYRPPRPVQDPVVMSGEAQPIRASGPMGWFQKRMEAAMQQQQERASARTGATSNASENTAEPAVTMPVKTPVATARRSNRGGNRGSGARTKKSAAAKANVARDATLAGGGQPDGAAPAAKRSGTTGRAVVVPRKARASSNDDNGRE